MLHSLKWQGPHLDVRFSIIGLPKAYFKEKSKNNMKNMKNCTVSLYFILTTATDRIKTTIGKIFISFVLNLFYFLLL